MTTAPKLPEGLEPALPPDLEALMPEPVKLVTACEDCCGTGHTGESQYMGEFQPPEYERCGSCDGSGKWIVDHHSPTQMREAILAATERALDDAYNAMFDLKGDKVTRFDAQTAIQKIRDAAAIGGASGQEGGGAT